jgi:hypothetical protein
MQSLSQSTPNGNSPRRDWPDSRLLAAALSALASVIGLVKGRLALALRRLALSASGPDPNGPRRRAWGPALFASVAAALILGSTYALVLIPGMAPHEWAAAVTFVAAHLLAAEVIKAIHGGK